MTVNQCKAYREQDQMVCGECCLQWDVNDTDRPNCKPVTKPYKSRAARHLRGLKKLRKVHKL